MRGGSVLERHQTLAEGAFAFGREFSATLAANTDDWGPADLGRRTLLLVDVTAPSELRGIAGGKRGRVLLLVNRGDSTLTVVPEAATSSANNRIATPAAGNFLIPPGVACWLVYQTSDSRWHLAMPATGAIPAAFSLEGVLSPTSMGSSQNNYNPTGLSGASVLRLTASAAVDVTGLSGGALGRVIIVHNIGATNAITLKDESGSSTAANRFALNGDIVLASDHAAILWYDATSSRWRCGGHTVAAAGGGGAPVGAQYVVLSADATLTDERVLTAGVNLKLSDAGAGAALTVDALSEAIYFPADISATLGADQNNYNPTGLATASTIRLTMSVANVTLTGLSGGADGRIVVIENVGGSNSYTLTHADAASSAANRFELPGGSSIVVGPFQAVVLRYDVTNARWHAIAMSLLASVPANGIAYSQLQDVSAASRLLGRGSAAGAGDPQELTVASPLAISGTQLTVSGIGAGSEPHVLVASADMPQSIKDRADLVCTTATPRNDQVEINQAIDIAAPLQSRNNNSVAGALQRGRVLLTGGEFITNQPILLQTAVDLSGMGFGTAIRPYTVGSPSFTNAGSGADTALVKLKAVDAHLCGVHDMWLDGLFASGADCRHGVYYVSSSGSNDAGAYPDSNPDPDCYAYNLYIHAFDGGSNARHGYFGDADMRGSLVHHLQVRVIRDNAVYQNGSPDSHFSDIHVGGAAGTGFRIAGANNKLTNCKAYYCDVWGFWVSSGRGMLIGCESQDNVGGVYLDGTPYAVEGLIVDTCYDVGLRVSNNKQVVMGADIFVRGGGRTSWPAGSASTQLTGLWVDTTVNDVFVTALVDGPSGITTPVQNFAGITAGTRNFARVSTGSGGTLLSHDG